LAKTEIAPYPFLRRDSAEKPARVNLALTNNPYQPPPPLEDDPVIGQPEVRPVGISILAVLHGLGGLLIGALGVFLATQFKEEDSSSIIAWVVVVVAPLLTVLSIATAIGLWLGHKWAWWLATLYYFQFVIGGACVLLTIPVAYLFLDRPITQRTVELLLEHIVRIVIFALLSGYMTKRKVFAYFQFKRLTRLRALGISTAAILALALLMGLLVFLALSMGARFA